MANVKNLHAVIAALRKRAAARLAGGQKVACIIGYTANYALFVHENLEMKLKGQPRPSGLGVYWGPNGTSKFLEGPFRSLAAQTAATVKEELQRGRTLGQALLLAGMPVLRLSQESVPVEYGDLRRSGFIRLEGRG